MKKADARNTVIQTHYETDEAARAVFENLAGRERNSWRPSVDLMSRQTNLSRGQVVRVFRIFESLQLGAFKVGRRGHQSRFEWAVSPLSVGQVAAREGEEITDITPEEKAVQDGPGAELVEHRFHLRADLPVIFELPKDLSHAEARRLADFLKTLPLGEPANV